MRIHGFQKTTLLDYPGKVAATIFTGSCNFRCPFCQNSGLVLHPEEEAVIPEEDVLAFLKKRRNILDGLCVTGGEPTLRADLIPFLEQIKALGYLVKLDTNGYRPEVLKELAGRKLIDYVAMDIKSSRETYAKVAGVPSLDLSLIEESVAFLMNGDLPYEFRTTVVRELHGASDFESIGEWLAGCQAYFLQSYKDSDMVMTSGLSAYTVPELKDFLNILLPSIPAARLRGVDE